MIAAAEGVSQEKAAKTITASGVFPQINAEASGSTAKTTTTSASGAKTKSTSDSYSYGVSGTQLIFDGLKTPHAINAASENIKAAEQSYRFTSSEVRSSLRTAFVNLLKAQELITVAGEIKKIRSDNLALIRLRYESGLEHRGALLTAEANLAGADFEFSQATRTLESVQRQLTKAMGRKTFTPITVKGDFIVRDAAREKPDFEKIVQDNPSLLEAAAKRNAALFDVKSAYGDFAPTVSATAGAGRTEGRWPPENDQWDFGLNVSMPVFEGGLRTAQVAKAKSAYKQAQANERSAHDTAIVSLAEAWVALQDAVETVGVQQKTLEAAVERSKIAQAQYSTGFINFDSWIIIENDLVQAKKSYLESEANALIIEANWIRAKGETLEHA